MPGEAELASQAETFVRAVGVVRSLRGARIGQVGVRPAAFETVFPKRGLSLKFSLTTSKIVCNPELVSGDFVQQHEDAT